MIDYKKERSISTVAALLLFAIFAVGVLSVLLGGAQSYQQLNERDEKAYHSRTCAQYLAARLQQAESPGAVSVVAFGDGNALQFAQNVEGEVYTTRIYCHDGWLMELFALDGGEFSAQDGERVLPASELTIARQGNVLLIHITDGSGQRLQLQHALRGGEEAP